MVCRDCGLVVEEHMPSWEPEPSYVGDDGVDPCRTGMPVDPLLPEMSMVTRVGAGAGGRFMGMLNSRSSIPSRERTLYKAFQQINAACEGPLKLSPAVASVAKSLFSDIRSLGAKRGAVYRALPCCAVFFAAKMAASYRASEMVCEAFGVQQPDFIKAHKHAIDECAGRSYYKDMVAPVQATTMLHIVLNGLPSLNRQDHGRVQKTVLAMHDHFMQALPDLVGSREALVAGAEVYVACDLLGLPQHRGEVAAAYGSSVTSLSKYIGRLVESLDTSQEKASVNEGPHKPTAE